jgi:predicted RNA-binding protein YlxR (DUF448 family)
MGRSDDDRGATERLCAATRTVRPVSELVRFVRAPDGSVIPDLKRKLPGRGVWVTATHAAVTEAVKRKVFARSFKEQVIVAPDLADQVEHLYMRHALDLFSLANKAGKVVTGFSKVESAIGAGGIAAVLHSAEAAHDGIRKLDQALRRAGLENKVRRLSPFAGLEMDVALGRSNVIHAALTADAVSNALLARADDLARYRGNETAGLAVPANDGNGRHEETDGE